MYYVKIINNQHFVVVLAIHDTRTLSTNGYETFKTRTILERINMKQLDAVLADITLGRTFEFSDAAN